MLPLYSASFYMADLSSESLEKVMDQAQAKGKKQKLVYYAKKGFNPSLKTFLLDSLEINQFPVALHGLKPKTLILSNNNLTFLPKELSFFVYLRVLSVAFNQIEHLPEEIGKLLKLQKLDLSSNQIKQLPLEIGLLNQLKVLDLSNNCKLTEVPLALGRLSNLSVLKTENTQISKKFKQVILKLCQVEREKKPTLIFRIKALFELSEYSLDLSETKKGRENQQQLSKSSKRTEDWLRNLEKAKSYQGNQRELINRICYLLKASLKFPGFEETFLKEIKINPHYFDLDNFNRKSLLLKTKQDFYPDPPDLFDDLLTECKIL